MVVGVTMINNYDKMQKVQNSLNALADKDNQEKEQEDDAIEAVGDDVTSEIQGDNTQGEESNGGDEQQNTDVPPSADAPSATDSPQDAQTPDNQTPEVQKPEDSGQMKEPEVYIVQKGDTLESISKEKYGNITYISRICELNDLQDGNLIFIGQKLLLP